MRDKIFIEKYLRRSLIVYLNTYIYGRKLKILKIMVAKQIKFIYTL